MTQRPEQIGNGQAASGNPPALSVSHLSYAYPDGTTALHDLSFSVAPSDTLALIGPNGAGKSTLLLHLNGLLPEHPPTAPSIHIFGQSVMPEHYPAIRRRVGLLFQDPNDQLFCPTVLEDVAYGPTQLRLAKSDVAARVRAALAQVGLVGFEHRLPHHLSGGEQRRVALAGVLACQPDLLVLDEPTSNLDPRSRRELITLLRGLSIPKLIATHDLELVLDLCPRALLLDRGRLVADASSQALLADEALMLAHGLEVPPSLRRSP